jgi:hypothetical protein
MMCDCLRKTYKPLAARNTSIVQTIPLKRGRPSMALLRTEQIETGRGKPKAVAVVATYCPICGKKYEADDV